MRLTKIFWICNCDAVIEELGGLPQQITCSVDLFVALRFQEGRGDVLVDGMFTVV